MLLKNNTTILVTTTTPTSYTDLLNLTSSNTEVLLGVSNVSASVEHSLLDRSGENNLELTSSIQRGTKVTAHSGSLPMYTLTIETYLASKLNSLLTNSYLWDHMFFSTSYQNNSLFNTSIDILTNRIPKQFTIVVISDKVATIYYNAIVKDLNLSLDISSLAVSSWTIIGQTSLAIPDISFINNKVYHQGSTLNNIILKDLASIDYIAPKLGILNINGVNVPFTSGNISFINELSYFKSFSIGSQQTLQKVTYSKYSNTCEFNSYASNANIKRLLQDITDANSSVNNLNNYSAYVDLPTVSGSIIRITLGEGAINTPYLIYDNAISIPISIHINTFDRNLLNITKI